jgi:hypothetical protein
VKNETLGEINAAATASRQLLPSREACMLDEDAVYAHL